jgi:hypothetical protein
MPLQMAANSLDLYGFLGNDKNFQGCELTKMAIHLKNGYLRLALRHFPARPREMPSGRFHSLPA